MARSEPPFAFVMAKDTVRDDGLDQKPADARPPGVRRDFREHGPRPTRYEVLERFLAVVPDAAGVIATTGKCGRELFTLADRPQHLYQVGSMGGASAMGLGVAFHTPRPVVVLDGDGAALMKLGNLATIGSRAPANLVHGRPGHRLGKRRLCGGRPGVRLRERLDVRQPAGFEQAYGATRDAAGPHLIHVRIAPGSLAKLGRPTVTPPEVARRFQRFLATA